MRWKYVAGGLFTLLVCSYLDSVRGPLLPVLNQTLHLSYSQSCWWLVAGYCAAVGTLFTLIPIFPRFGSRQVTLGICALGAAGSLCGWLVDGFARLVVFGIVLGSIVASSGAICNLLVMEGTDLERRSRYLCALHTMYGFGSLVSPAVASVILGAGLAWPCVVGLAFPLFLALALFCAWGLVEPSRAERAATRPDVRPGGVRREPLSGMEWLVILIFVFYTLGEVLTSTWMVPYLVEVRMVDITIGARYLSCFFLAMGVSRLLAFLFIKPRLETLVLFASLLVFALAFVLAHARSPWAFPLAGLVGPFYPIFLARVSRRFSLSAARLTLWILTFVQLSLALGHFLVGRLSESWGLERTYVLPLFFMTLAFAGLWIYLQRECRPLGADATPA